MCKSLSPIPVGTVVKFKIWDTEKDGQGIGIILEHKIKLGSEVKYRVHFKRFPELVYLQSDPTELTISQSDIKEVLDTGARICSITNKPINDGYVWDNGGFYCCDDNDVMVEEIKREIDDYSGGWSDAEKSRVLEAGDAGDIINEYYELLEEKGYDFYYTDWELDEEVLNNGEGWFVLEEGNEQFIFDIFDYSPVRKAYEEICSDPKGYDDMGFDDDDDELTSERMEEISNTEGAEDIECETCGHINTHDTEKFGFCVSCLEHIV